MGDATSVNYALIAMLMIVSISFQKQANRDLKAVLSQICSPGSDPARSAEPLSPPEADVAWCGRGKL
jgi:hypothetical protein